MLPLLRKLWTTLFMAEPEVTKAMVARVVGEVRDISVLFDIDVDDYLVNHLADKDAAYDIPTEIFLEQDVGERRRALLRLLINQKMISYAQYVHRLKDELFCVNLDRWLNGNSL